MKRTVICASACLALAMLGAGAASAQPAHCPPGLAKKAVPCVPPGQAKKGLRPGDRLPDDSGYVIIRDYDRYGLPRPDDGSRYVRLDNDVLRVVVETGRIIESVAVLNDILN